MDNTERICECGQPYVKTRTKAANKCPACIKADITAWRKNNPDRCGVHAKKGRLAMRARDPEGFKQKARQAANRHRQRLSDGTATLRAILSLLVLRATRGLGRKRVVPVIELTADDLVEIWVRQNGRCALSGMAMMPNRKNLKSVSLDRKKNDGPYSRDNVQLVCRWANFAKNHHTDEELIEVLTELKRHA